MVRRLAVMFSPTVPSPRVVPWTKRPDSYFNETARPSIFSSHMYSTSPTFLCSTLSPGSGSACSPPSFHRSCGCWPAKGTTDPLPGSAQRTSDAVPPPAPCHHRRRALKGRCPPRVCLQLIHRLRSETPLRRIDDAFEADVVIRVQDHLQIAHEILDFLTVVELDAADHLVCDVRFDERILDRPRLG